MASSFFAGIHSLEQCRALFGFAPPRSFRLPLTALNCCSQVLVVQDQRRAQGARRWSARDALLLHYLQGAHQGLPDLF